MRSQIKRAERKRTFLQSIAREARRNWGLYLLVSIPLLYLILFKYWPMYGVQIAFRNYSPARTISGSPWVGLKYFKKFMGNYQFKRILVNTIAISLYSLATFPLPIVLAVLLNYVTRTRFKKAVQMVSYMPHFISTVVMVGIILQFLDVRSGLLNMVLNFFGLESLKWIDSSETAMMSVIIVALWKAIGYNTMLIYAAIQNVPAELYEAADLDNATSLKKFFKITLPMISPQMFMLLITATTGSFRVFDTIRVMTHGGPGTSTQVLVYYIYKQAFVLQGKVGYAFSAAVVLMLMIGVVTIAYFRVLSKRVHYQ